MGRDLYEAASNGDFWTFERILRRSNFNWQDKDGCTPIFAAARNGRTGVMSRLIAARCDINLANKNGGTPIYIAALYGHTDAVKQLIAAGCDMTRAARSGKTPLQIAEENGHASIATLIRNAAYQRRVSASSANAAAAAAAAAAAEAKRKEAANAAAKGASASRSLHPLHVHIKLRLYDAASKGKTSEVVALLSNPEARSFINWQNEEGWTPIYIAAGNGHTGAVKELTSAGCDINRATKDGETPIYAAACCGKTHAVKELIAARCDINRADKDGCTPIFIAARWGHMDAVKEMISAGCDMTRAAKSGKTPLQVAEEKGHASVATLIRNEAKRLEEEKAREVVAPAGGGAAAAAASGSSSSSANAAHLRRLFEMGFTDTNRNAVLLEEEDLDINKVVDRLTLDSPGTPDAGGEGRVGGGLSSEDQSVPSSKGGEITGIQLDIGRAYIDSSLVLGKGSFADVFRGTYRFSGQQVEKGVAIKTFRGAQNLTPSMRKKIEEEVVVWTRLSHPNLVRLYGILTDPSHGPCLVLELCVASLRSLLNQADEGQMKMPWNIREKWLLEVACGMTELHSLSPQSIIHRDLKAANVLLSSNDLASAVAKVTDFGVAMTLETVRSSSSAGGGGAGTLQWMAPETFKGRYSQKTDVYSFAVLAFEMATNKVPYEGLSVPEINQRAMSRFEFDEEQFQEDGVDEAKQRARWNKKNPLHTRRPDLVGQVQSGCPSFLGCLIEKCWSDNPDERPEFKQILDSLGKLQEGRPYWGDGGNGVRVVLPDGAEKTDILKAFQNTLGAVQTTVTMVERVQNPKLWGPFAAVRQTMLERQGDSDSYERTWLFHGTAEDSVDKIVAHGFNRIFGFKEVNRNAMTKFGKGVYFAVNSKYSLDYTTPNSRGERHMFLCRVLVGQYCLGREDQPTPDVRSGTELYDSTVNNLEAPTIFVTYNDSQAYPQYIVTFTKE